MTESRVLDLEGVHNFRDYGGYAVRGGGRLRRGVLWRSGQHNGATDADLANIAGLGLASVFDLRTSIERSSHPCRRPPEFAAKTFHAEDPGGEKAPHIAAAMRAMTRSPDSMRAGMRRNYETIAFRPELLAIMRTFLAELAKGKGPSLVNCMAGKDRTGIAVAMVHLATGVHRDDIIGDYVLTNTAGDAEARIVAGIRTMREMRSTLDEEAARVVMGVEPEYLETAFDSIAARHGSLDAYLKDELGADEAVRERLRHSLVES